jgi:hypothetical protein
VAHLERSDDNDDEESKDPNIEEEEDEDLDMKAPAIDYAYQCRKESDNDANEEDDPKHGGGAEKPAPKVFGPKQLPFAIGGGDDPDDDLSDFSS